MKANPNKYYLLVINTNESYPMKVGDNVNSKPSHENKKNLKSILSLETFLIENECKTPYGCHTFIFYQKHFL